MQLTNSSFIQPPHLQLLEQQIAAQSLSDEAKIAAFAVSDVFNRVITSIVNFFLTSLCPSFGLRLAACYDDHQRFHVMMAAGADINSKSFFTGLTAMHYAAKNGHSVMIRTLKDHGAFIDPTNEDGYTPLHIAIEKGQINAMATLIHLGANVQNKVNVYTEDVTALASFTALHLAAKNGQDHAVNLLLFNGSNIHEVTHNNRTALQLAIEFGHTQLAKNLITAQMNSSHISVNSQDVSGMTALHDTALIGNTDLILPLLGAGANMDIKDKNGNTPLLTAIANGQFEVAKDLIACGANVNIANSFGVTPLHQVTANISKTTEFLGDSTQKFENYEAIILALLDKGADAGVQTINGFTPLCGLLLNYHTLISFTQVVNSTQPDLIKNHHAGFVPKAEYNAQLVKIALADLRKCRF